MAHEFFVGGAVPRVVQFGGGCRHLMREHFRRLRYDNAVGRFGPNCYYDPLTGTVGPRVDYSPQDEDLGRWGFAGAAATDFVLREFPREENNTKVVYYKENTPTTWSATYGELLKTGQGLIFFVHSLGTQIQLAFGSGWVLEMLDQTPIHLKFGGVSVDAGPNFEFSHRDLYFTIWNVGPILRINYPPDYLEGVAFDIRNIRLPFDENGRPFALGNGQVAIQGDGTTWFALRELRWENEWGFELGEQIPLWNPSTQPSTGLGQGYFHAGVSATLSITNELGAAFTAGGTAFKYAVDVSNDSDPLERWRAAHIYRVGVSIPRTLGDSGTTGTDLQTIGPVDEVVWEVGVSAAENVLRLRWTDDLSMAAYLEHGLRLDWIADLTTLFTGLITDLRLVEVGFDSNSGKTVEELHVTANASEILYSGTAFNIPDQAGSTLAQALTEAFNAAGIPAGNITVTAADLSYVIPDMGETPVAPKAGESPGHFIDWLLATFLPSHQLRCGSNFTFAIVPKDDTVTTPWVFSETYAGAGDGVVYADTVRVMDDDRYHNAVICVGQDDFGNLITAAAINWTDINNEPPYRMRALIIIDSGLRTQEVVNRACLLAFLQHSEKLVSIEFEGDYIVGALPGHRMVVGTLGTYRMTQRSIKAQGDNVAVWRVTYQGVKVA